MKCAEGDSLCPTGGLLHFSPFPPLLFWLGFHISLPTLHTPCPRALILVTQGGVLSD